MPRRPLVLAIAIAAAVLACNRTDGARPAADDMPDWAAMPDDTRPGIARLSAPVPHRPHGPAARQRSLVRDAARARLERRLERTREPAPLHASAVLEFLSGRAESAAALLEETLEQQPSDAGVWNDLGVVHLARWETEREDGRRLIRAFDAFLRAANADPARPEPRFNLAVTYSRLGLNARARSMVTELQALPDAEPWRAEAAALMQTVAADPIAEWKPTHDRIHGAGLDASAMAAASQRFPQAVRECVEDHLLGAWGASLLSGKIGDAGARLSVIRALAQGIEARSGDRLLADTVREIEGGGRVRELATAFMRFTSGRDAYEAGRYEPARSDFGEADRILASARSVFAPRNRIELATTVYQFRDVGRARAAVAAVLRDADERHRTIAARAEWLHGLTQMQGGAIEAALSAFERSYARYVAIGEVENAAAVTNTACDSLRIVGERGRGWSLLASRVLATLPEARSVRRRYVALLNASLYASADGFDHAALAFQDASLDAARERGVANTIVEALTRRAALYVRRRAWPEATADIAEARRQLAALPSTASVVYQRAWLDSVEGEWLASVDPARAPALLDAAVEQMQRVEPSEVPRILLVSANAAAARGDGTAAEARLRDGLRIFEGRWAALGRDTSRTAYLDEGWNLYRALARRYTRHDAHAAEAFTTLERGKGIALMKLRRDTSAPVETMLGELQKTIPPAAATLYFSVVDDALLSWIITADAVRFTSRAFDHARMARRIGSYRLLLETRRPSSETARLSAALFGELLAPSLTALPPAITTLAVVPDDVLHWVPFATLTNAATGRLLVDDFEVIVASSAKELIDSTARLRASPPGRMRVLAVGNGSASIDGRLPRLPEAEAEAADVAARYARRMVLLGRDANSDHVRRLSAAADILHFAGHAVANDVAPERSFLLMAPSASGAVTVTGDEISRWPLGNLRLAVLSACRTASGAVSRGEGILGLARPFLAAGVPAVVGAAWDVDDYATRAMVAEFHAAYAATGDAPASLRRAQLKLKASSDPRLRDPGAWGAFVVMSGFAHGIS